MQDGALGAFSYYCSRLCQQFHHYYLEIVHGQTGHPQLSHIGTGAVPTGNQLQQPTDDLHNVRTC